LSITSFASNLPVFLINMAERLILFIQLLVPA
jgi:hypothetical protein